MLFYFIIRSPSNENALFFLSLLKHLTGIRASNKKPDVDIGDKARSIKSKFENGEVFKDEQNHTQQQIDDSAVFEHGIIVNI